jgi:hypothetical protein
MDAAKVAAAVAASRNERMGSPFSIVIEQLAFGWDASSTAGL